MRYMNLPEIWYTVRRVSSVRLDCSGWLDQDRDARHSAQRHRHDRRMLLAPPVNGGHGERNAVLDSSGMLPSGMKGRSARTSHRGDQGAFPSVCRF